MYLLTDGRTIFLEFLRNLTPQALLLSLAFVTGSRLDLNEWDLSNWAQTFIFLMFVALALLSGIANASLFIGRFAPMFQVRRAFKRFDPRLHRKLPVKVRYAWRKKGIFFEAAFVLLSVELGIVAVFLTAMETARTMVP
ncbi:hypothetical protein [Massilia sp. METH4]|uniref:hypothetical protein n=1 Tax=Massilia sp. METH4 TaxID=3123041 RepID=UPI0030D01DBC